MSDYAKIVRALTIAKKRIHAERLLLLECHSVGATGLLKDVRDARGHQAIAALDRDLSVINAALNEVGA